MLNNIIKYSLLTFFIGFVCTAHSQIVKYKTDEVLEESVSPDPDSNSPFSWEYRASKYIKLKPGFKYKARHTDDEQFLRYSFKGKIDKTMIYETDYENPVSSFSTSVPVGSLPGNVNVGLTGAASYSIPIALPPGTAGMLPGLSISYSSQSGDGMLGRGWTIGGFSSITRTPSTIHHDGFIDEVDFDGNDRFSLDGQRLVAVEGTTYGEVGAVYHTEMESFSEIMSLEGSVNMPNNFIVRTKDGKTLEFGTKDHAKIKLGDTEKVLSWMLNKVTDIRGNFYTITYGNHNGEVFPERIDYTGSTDFLPYNSVHFAYSEKTDQKTVYIDGCAVKSSLILDEISIKSFGKIVKQYKFNYDFDHVSRLNEITLYEDENLKLNSTKIDWGNEDTALSFAEQKDLQVSSNDPVIWGDFNGDGLTDYVTKPDTRLILHIAKKDETDGELSYTLINYNQIILNASLSNLKMGDFNGDGKQDFIYHTYEEVGYGSKKAIVHLILANSNGLSFTKTDLEPYYLNYLWPGDNRVGEVRLGDFNGDGKTDWLEITAGPALTGGYPDPGTAFTNFTIRTYTNTVTPTTLSTTDYNRQFHFSNIYVTESNGNGKSEITFRNTDSEGNSSFFVNEINAESRELSSFPSGAKLYGDFNGDGKGDFFIPSSSSIFLSTGKEYIQGVSPVLNNTVDASKNIYYVTDFDGNGYSDILEYEYISELNFEQEDDEVIVYYTFKLRVLLNYGYEFQTVWTKTLPNVQLTFHSGGSVVSGQFNPIPGLDVDGDGQQDFITNMRYHSQSATGYHAVKLKPLRHKNIVDCFTDGFDNKTKLEYKTLTDPSVNIASSGKLSYPFSYARFPLQVVSVLKVPNGIGGENSTRYMYGDAIVHKTGKGFLGFGTNTAIDVQTGIVSQTSFEIDDANHLLLPKETYVAGTSSDLTTIVFDASKTTLTYAINEDIANEYGTIFQYVSESVTDDYLTNITGVKSTFLYDDFGNIKTQTLEHDADNYVVTENEYFHAPTASDKIWSWSRVESTTVTKKRLNQPEDTRTSRFEYLVDGFLYKSISNPGDTDFEITTQYEYFPLGKLKKTTVSAVDDTERITSHSYDEKFRFPLTSTDIDGNETSATFDNEFGNTLTSTDINGNVSEFFYNKLGTLIGNKLPDGIESETLVHWYTGSTADRVGAFYYSETKTNTSGLFSSFIFYDKFGRVVRSEKPSFSSEEPSSTDTRYIVSTTGYNAWGKVAKQSLPYFMDGGVEKNTLYEYYPSWKNVGKLKKTTSHSGQTVDYTYVDKVTTVTASSGDEKITTINQFGETKFVKDKSDEIITYTYNSSGQPTLVSLSNSSTGTPSEVHIGYDIFGRRTSIDDPDAGLTSYTYDAWGQIETQKDAELNLTTMVYSPQGRLISKSITNENNSEIDEKFEYVYGTSGNNKALIIEEKYEHRVSGETEPSINTKSYIYDNLSRISSATETFEGVDYTYTFGYDEFGRMNKHTYPGEEYYYTKNFNDAGFLYQIIDKNGIEVWEKEETNELGQTTMYSKGNGIRTIKSFDDNNYLQNVVSGSFQDMTYAFEAQTANLLSRTDNITGNSERFEYDDLNRLEFILKGTEQNTDLGVYKMDYSTNGNIEHKPDAGTFAYNHQTKFHAVTGVTGSNVADIPSFEQDIAYTAFNKVETISEVFEGDITKLLTFSYGFGNNRKKTVLREGGVVTQTKHFFGNYETVEVGNLLKKIHYLPGGAVYIQEGNNGTVKSEMLYIYSDHLGSITHVTDDAGVLIQEYSYDAWGRMRSPDDWNICLTVDETSLALSLINGRGYTGHEHLAEFGIINMNGRLYDPVLGRMLSPDNFVQAPDFSQNFNRFSYVYNNPLKYTDPSGEFAVTTAILIGAAVFGTANLAIQAANGEIDNFGDGAKAFVAGAVAGAVITGGVSAGLAVPILGTALKGAGIIYGSTTALSLLGGINQGALYGDWSRLENSGKIFAGNFYLDSNRSLLGQTWQGISRFSWELPQSTVGHGYAQLRNTFGIVDRVDYFGGATFSTNVRPGASSRWGVSIGNHINIQRTDNSFDIMNDPLLMHEYGHTFDSQMFGLTYLLSIGIPSASGAEWTEHRANRHAARYFGDRFGVNWTPFLGQYPLGD